jgi:hypothetical protein
MQPVEFVELLVAEHACSGHAGDACDRRHGPIGTHQFSRGNRPAGFKWRVLHEARFEIGEAGFGFTSRAKHCLQGLGLLIDFEFDEIHRAFERDGLRLQINLPCDAGAREILAVFCNRQSNFVGQSRDFGVQLFAPPLEAEFLGARFAQCIARFVGAGVDLADRLFDQRDLVAVLGVVDGLAAMAARSRPMRARMPS